MIDRIIYAIFIVLMPACGVVWFLDIHGPPSAIFTAFTMALVWVFAVELLLKTFQK